MLIATILTLLFLGSDAGLMADGIDQMHDNIKDRIVDESTRKAALGVVDSMKDTTKDYAKADNDGEKELLKLIQQYGTTTEQLQSHLDASYEQRVEYQQQMLVLRFELKNKLSREQWEKVFSKSNITE